MGCSQPKLSRTGLRNILAFLKVELQHFLGGTRTLLRFAARRGLSLGLAHGASANGGSSELFHLEGANGFLALV